MKRDAVGWFAAGLLLACLMGAMQQTGRAGRFQIVCVQDYPVKLGAGAGAPRDVQPFTLRLDTETGETRVLNIVWGGESHWGRPVAVKDLPR
jgi:hypothetical protein